MKGLLLNSICFLLLICNNSKAQEVIPNSKGFHGFFRLGYGVLQFRNNEVARFMSFKLNTATINSIYNVPPIQNTTITTIPLEIGYTIVPYKTHIFLGNQLEDLIRFDVTQQLGIKQRVENIGVLHFGILYSSIPTFVWEDPFLTGTERSPTKRTAFGAVVSLDQIFNSGIRVQYSWRDVHLGNELSGSQLNLNVTDLQSLNRNGDMHSIELMYRFYFKQKHRIVPGIRLIRDKRDGKAISRLVSDFSINYILHKKQYSFIANGLLGRAKYDEINPIYSLKQDSWRYGISASFFLVNPWQWKLFEEKPLRFVFTAAYNYVDSDIEFYQQRGLLFQLGILKRW